MGWLKQVRLNQCGWAGRGRAATQRPDSDVRGRVEATLRDMGATTLPTENPGMFVVAADPWIGP